MDTTNLLFSATPSLATAAAADDGDDTDVYCAVLGRHTLGHASSSQCWTVQLTALTGALFSVGVARPPIDVNALPQPLPTTVFERRTHSGGGGGGKNKNKAVAEAARYQRAAAPEFWVYCPLARSKTYTRAGVSGKPSFYGPQSLNPALNLANVIAPAQAQAVAEDAHSSSQPQEIAADSDEKKQKQQTQSSSAQSTPSPKDWVWTVDCDLERGSISFYEPNGLCLGAAFVNIPDLHECIPFATISGTGFALRFEFDRPTPKREPLVVARAGRVMYVPPAPTNGESNAASKRWIPVPIEQLQTTADAVSSDTKTVSISQSKPPPKTKPSKAAAATSSDPSTVKLSGALGGRSHPKAQRQPKPKTAGDLAKKQAAHKLIKLHPSQFLCSVCGCGCGCGCGCAVLWLWLCVWLWL